MGKKKRHNRRKDRDDNLVEDDFKMDDGYRQNEGHRQGAKSATKKRKKMKRKLAEQTIRTMRPNNLRDDNRSAQSLWHSVNIVGKSALEKEFILPSIGSHVDIEFRPLGFYKMGESCGFYLENNKAAANAISGMNLRIQGPDGNRLKINVKKCGLPELVLNTNQLQLLREVLSQRFNTEHCLLDLSEFHNEPRFIENDILAPIASHSIMKQVVRTIGEHIPHLKALNLSKNNIRQQRLMDLKPLRTPESQLAALNLEDNNIDDLSVLNLIKMFPLTELKLQYNPFMSKFLTDPARYIKTVRREIPSVKLVDNVNIDDFLEKDRETRKKNGGPSQGQSQSAATTSADTSVSSTSAMVPEQMVRTFLEQFYALVDSPERSNLVAAYTPDAVFEVKSAVNGIGSSVFVGHSHISEALGALPATQHQHNTFTFKIEALNPGISQALVSGQLQVAGLNGAIAFARKMNIIPFNAGYCCSQDILELRSL